MANNIMQMPRTSVAGRIANSTTLPNSGQIGINVLDGIAFSTNGTNWFALGGNNLTVNVSSTLNVGNSTVNLIVNSATLALGKVQITANGLVGSSGQALLSGGVSGNDYWGTPTAVAGAAGANTQVQFNDSATTNGVAGFTFDKTTNIVFVSNTINVSSTTTNTVIGWDTADSSTIETVGNINGFTEIAIWNANTGALASADLIVNDTLGPDASSNNYIDVGINGSGFANAAWTINGPSDGYLYTGNNALSIGTQANKYLNFFANGTLSTCEVMRITGGKVSIGNVSPVVLTVGNSTVNVTISNGYVSTTGAQYALGIGFALP